MDEVKRLLATADADLLSLREEVHELTTVTRKSTRRSLLRDVLLGVAVAVALVAVVVSIAVQVVATNRERCVERWAHQYTSRAQVVTSAAAKRSDALDVLVRAAAQRNQRAALAALSTYLHASDAYNRVVRANPIPVPNLHC